MPEYHYWLTARDPESGKPYLIYGCTAREGEQTARERGIEMLGNLDFNIKRLATRNQATASQIVKGGKLEKTHSLHESSRRIGHSKSLRQRSLRQRKSGSVW